MTDSARDNLSVVPNTALSNLPSASLRHWGMIAALAAALVIMGILLLGHQNAAVDAPLLEKSTLGQLGIWIADQSTLEAPVSLLGQFAKNQAVAAGQTGFDAAAVAAAMRSGLVVFMAVLLMAGIAGLVGAALGKTWARGLLLIVLVGLDVLLFIVPPTTPDSMIPHVLIGIVLLLAVLLLTPGQATKLLGFIVVLSALLVTWESIKAFSALVNYQITLPQTNWNANSYESLDAALTGLQQGEIQAVVVDKKDVEALVPPFPESGDSSTLKYQDLRILTDIETESRLVGFPLIPAFPGRLVVVSRTADVSAWNNVTDLIGKPVGTYKGAFSEEKFLNVPRSLLLVDLHITNDLNLPHLQSILESLLQPARRNGELLLVRILSETAIFTWSEAAIGFVIGAFLGFVLGTIFAHSRLLERGLLPYVVASQTVPILAIAPMIVIWLGAGPGSVSVISAYLTFFPVTINTLRGLTSPHPTTLELMHSYAANRWEILWKLRFPAALPYIFTALKVSATTSVVGAIIGELPTGVSQGLGRTILNFNQYYTSDPSKLWATILVAALVGIGFFVAVTILEWLILRNRVQSV